MSLEENFNRELGTSYKSHTHTNAHTQTQIYRHDDLD